jgi:hypothetical protein
VYNNSPRFWVMLCEFFFSIVGFLFVVYIVRKISVGRGRLETRWFPLAISSSQCSHSKDGN